ncbi:TetR/AcrR family transcriptional regulator [Streptomyces sp. NPDC048330]|uniref:TetR/AcrR family transcriptional regulator n=1 Tax=Streptomyces sp. NPDC048330 TaxID=3365533 RepID=UPI00371EDFD7
MLDDEKVASILAAAYTCFTHHGVRRTTMDDIAREAGMSRPAVYHYVRNKEDAFRRLVERLLTDTLDQARSAARDATLDERLSAILSCKLALVSKVWADSPAHAPELLGPDTRLSADMIRKFDDGMLELISGEIGAEHPYTDAREVAEILLALTRGLEANLADAAIPADRLDRGVRLVVAGLSTSGTPETLGTFT